MEKIILFILAKGESLKLEWLGEEREIMESLFLWSNNYANGYKKPFAINDNYCLSASEIQVIEYLLENEEMQLNMAGVAKRLGISKSSFTLQVTKLEQIGLLKKYYQEGNKKNLIVLVTDEGKQLYDEYSKKMTYIWKSTVLDPLDSIPMEYKSAIAKVIRNMIGTSKKFENAQKPHLIPIDKM